MATIEDWIAQQPNLKQTCEQILGKAISDRTWYNWERTCGAVYNQGQKLKERKYTDEQTQLLLCLAWYRRHHPRTLVTYASLRTYWRSNIYKIEEVFNAWCNALNNPQPKEQQTVELIPLSKVKRCCDKIANRILSRECWSNWKKHLGIARYAKFVEEGKASLLVFMACWRHDNPTTAFPSVRRLSVLMSEYSRRAMVLDTASSTKMQHKWEMQGCLGRDLPKYLAACGYKVATRTLYAWREFHSRKHYSPFELLEWKKLAKEKYGT